jgi:dipeptidyl aminopeptidase/acylaminoacyl peptidase
LRSRSRLKIVTAFALALAALAFAAMARAADGGSGGAAMPAGPRISFLEIRYPAKHGKTLTLKQIEGAFRVNTVDGNGHDPRRFPTPGLVTAGLGTVSWSADGEEVAYLGLPASKAAAETEGGLRIYVAAADGSGPHAVPGAKGGTQPVLSPDGRWVAFSRYREHHGRFNPKDPIAWTTHSYASTTTWIAPVAGGKPRRLTPWGNGRFSSPSSFSPDGSLLAVTVDTLRKPQAVELLDVATGKPRRVEPEAGEAAFSPDGTRIAFTSYRDHESAPGFDGPVAMAELYVANADFSGARRITRTAETDESGPSWAPGGDRLAFLATAQAEDLLGLGAGVVESNADGTCARTITPPRTPKHRFNLTIQAPTWVPGPGREPAPLSC